MRQYANRSCGSDKWCFWAIYQGVVNGMARGLSYYAGVEGSVLIIECNQARIHQSTDTTFLLRVKSNPIIEHCSRLRYILCHRVQMLQQTAYDMQVQH